MRKRVSVLTPTWQRYELLGQAIQNVRQQTYRPLEHVIVSDGQDDEAVALVRHERGTQSWTKARVPIRFVELGRNWSTFLPNAYTQAPMLVAMLIACGDYQVWLADDERMEHDHVKTLVDALESDGTDFAYSQARMYMLGSTPEQGWTIGTDPPQQGQITNVLYRADLLKRGLYQMGDDRASDWRTVEAWMNAGATWSYVPRVTLTHRADR